MLKKAFSYLSFLSVLLLPLHTEPFRVDNNLTNLNLTPWMDFYQDNSAQLTIENIEQADVPWIRNTASAINLGFTEHNLWLRFKLAPESVLSDDLIFEIDYALLRNVEFYTPAGEREYRVQTKSYQSTVSPVDIRSRKIIFTAERPRPDRYYYFHIKTNLTLIFQLQISTKKYYLSHLDTDNMLLWVYFGALLAIAIFYLFQYISLKEKTYLFFTLFVLSWFMLQFIYFGFFRYFFPLPVRLLNAVMPVALNTTCLTSGLFYMYFLEFKEKYPRLFKLTLYINIYPCSLAILLSLILPYRIMVLLSIGISFLIPLYHFIISLYAYAKKNQFAIYLIIAFFFNQVFTVFNVFFHLGLFHNYLLGTRGNIFGSLLIFFLSSFGLAYKMQIIKNQLTNSEQKFRLLFENANEAICLLQDGKIILANPVLGKLTGYLQAELRSKSLAELIHPEKKADTLRIYHDFLKEQQPVRQYETALLDKQQHRVDVEFSCSRLRYHNIMAVQILITDITARKQTEQIQMQLTRDIQAKSNYLEQIIYATSHDLRTPIINVSGFAKELSLSCKKIEDIFINGCRNPDQEQSVVMREINSEIDMSLGYITKSAAKMERMLNGLLEFSRIGAQQMYVEKIRMQPFIQEVVSHFQYKLDNSNAILSVEILPDCKADKDGLFTVFSNLIDNAIKYLDHKRPGKIRITGKSEAGRVIYCIADNGVGIDPKFREKIFTIFYRLHPQSDTGLGLGMTIVHKIIERLGGELWLESEPGAGSRFFIALPE